MNYNFCTLYEDDENLSFNSEIFCYIGKPCYWNGYEYCGLKDVYTGNSVTVPDLSIYVYKQCAKSPLPKGGGGGGKTFFFFKKPYK